MQPDEVHWKNPREKKVKRLKNTGEQHGYPIAYYWHSTGDDVSTFPPERK